MKITMTRRAALGTWWCRRPPPWSSAPRGAFAKNDHDELIKAFTGGKEPTKGKVKLDLPDIAENGNTVPLAFTVESPMTPESSTSRTS